MADNRLLAQTLMGNPWGGTAALDKMHFGNGQFSAGRLPGTVEQGNINLGNRPAVKNPDGSISSVRSMSFNDGAGEVLVPTVSDDGRIMSEDEAVNAYRMRGRHLGKFDTPETATAYAEMLHQEQAARTPQAVAPDALNNPALARLLMGYSR